jgi:hypothetical protein
MIRRVAMLITILGTCLLVPHGASAGEATAQEAGKELGAILGWRLGPEAIEERCRDADPEGAQVRKEALDAWLAKNDPLIKAVDSRVAGIVPQIQRASAGSDPSRCGRYFSSRCSRESRPRKPPHCAGTKRTPLIRGGTTMDCRMCGNRWRRWTTGK